MYWTLCLRKNFVTRSKMIKVVTKLTYESNKVNIYKKKKAEKLETSTFGGIE